MVTRHTIAKQSTDNIKVLTIGKNNIFPNISHKIMKVNIFYRPEEAMLDTW